MSDNKPNSYTNMDSFDYYSDYSPEGQRDIIKELEAENQRLRELIKHIIDSVPGGVLDEAPHQEIIDSIYEEKKLLEDK